MLMKLVKAVAIKPSVLRISVELWEQNFIQGEFEIAVDFEKYVKQPEKEGDEVQFDFDAFKQYITHYIGQLMFANELGRKLTMAAPMAWGVRTQDEENGEQLPNTSAQPENG